MFFCQLHGYIFAPHEACFQHRETGRHEEDQKTGDQEHKCGEDEANISVQRRCVRLLCHGQLRKSKQHSRQAQ